MEPETQEKLTQEKGLSSEQEFREHLLKLQSQIEHLTHHVKKTHKEKGFKSTRIQKIDERKAAIIDLVKSYPNGVPLEKFYELAEKAGYVNKKGAGIYFRQDNGILLIATLPTGENRVFFNPKKFSEIG